MTDGLSATFFERPVLDVARDLIGCTFLFDGVGGRIVETEAYAPGDPASHGYRGQTARNAVMFGPPGHLYVYFTYGMHFCANFVSEANGVGAAVLLRALEPLSGLDEMAARRGTAASRLLCSGPARLCQALGIGREHNGLPVWEPPITVLPREGSDPAATPGDAAELPPMPPEPQIVTTARIGMSAGDDGRRWRFVDAQSAFLSRGLRDNGV